MSVQLNPVPPTPFLILCVGCFNLERYNAKTHVTITPEVRLELRCETCGAIYVVPEVAPR